MTALGLLALTVLTHALATGAFIVLALPNMPARPLLIDGLDPWTYPDRMPLCDRELFSVEGRIYVMCASSREQERTLMHIDFEAMEMRPVHAPFRRPYLIHSLDDRSTVIVTTDGGGIHVEPEHSIYLLEAGRIRALGLAPEVVLGVGRVRGGLELLTRSDSVVRRPEQHVFRHDGADGWTRRAVSLPSMMGAWTAWVAADRWHVVATEVSWIRPGYEFETFVARFWAEGSDTISAHTYRHGGPNSPRLLRSPAMQIPRGDVDDYWQITDDDHLTSFSRTHRLPGTSQVDSAGLVLGAREPFVLSSGESYSVARFYLGGRHFFVSVDEDALTRIWEGGAATSHRVGSGHFLPTQMMPDGDGGHWLLQLQWPPEAVHLDSDLERTDRLSIPDRVRRVRGLSNDVPVFALFFVLFFPLGFAPVVVVAWRRRAWFLVGGGSALYVLGALALIPWFYELVKNF